MIVYLMQFRYILTLLFTNISYNRAAFGAVYINVTMITVR